MKSSKYSKAMRQRWKNKVYREAQLKRLSSPEFKERQRLAVRESAKKQWLDPEYREKMTAMANSVEWKRKTMAASSLAMKKKWKNDAEYREKLVRLGRRHMKWLKSEPSIVRKQKRNQKLAVKKLWMNKEFRQKRIEASRAWAIKLNRHLGLHKPTSLERKLYSSLRKNKISFKRQYPILNVGTVADAFLPDYNHVVYADGTYWHSKTKDYDKRQVARLRRRGYSVTRIREEYFDSDFSKMSLNLVASSKRS